MIEGPSQEKDLAGATPIVNTPRENHHEHAEHLD